MYIYYYIIPVYTTSTTTSAPQTPQTLFDADFEGLASNAELYIFNQEDSQEQAWAYLGYVLVYANGYVV